MEKLIIVGTGSTAEHLFRFVKGYNLFDVLGFAVNKKYLTTSEFLGLPVYAIEELEYHIDMSEVKLFVAVLWNKLNADRKKLYLELKEKGYSFANVISPHSIIQGNIIGDNCWIHDFAVIQYNATIKNDVIMRAMAFVGPNSVIEDHCFLGVKSVVAGSSIIGEQSFVGINCTVFDDTKVGEKCILGACTAVKRNVPDYGVYKTSSDFTIKTYDENTIEEKLMFTKNVRDIVEGQN